MNLAELKDPQASHSEAHNPQTPLPRVLLWVFAGMLVFAYMGVQIVVALPAVFYIMVTRPRLDPEMLVREPLMIWASIIALAIAAIVTAMLAFGWPFLWRLVKRDSHALAADWLGWRPPKSLPLWSVPLITLPFMIAVGYGVSMTAGASEVEIQSQMFSGLPMQIVSLLVVSTIVPVAEEAIFRGALFNAILKRSPAGWKSYILPVVITSLTFALLHVASGFVSLGPIIQITILAFYLGTLRAATDSLWPSLAAHMTWNLVGAIALSLSNTVKLP